MIMFFSDSLATNVTLYKTDKIYPGLDKLPNLKNPLPVVLIYGDLRDKVFYHWHNEIIKLVQSNKCHYVFRHRIKVEY